MYFNFKTTKLIILFLKLIEIELKRKLSVVLFSTFFKILNFSMDVLFFSIKFSVDLMFKCMS